MFLVLVFINVTVQPALINSILIGLPTKFDDPIINAFNPIKFILYNFNNFITPHGVHGCIMGLP